MASKSVPTVLLSSPRAYLTPLVFSGILKLLNEGFGVIACKQHVYRVAFAPAPSGGCLAPVVGLTVKGLGFALCIAAYCVDKFLVFVLFPISDGIGYMDEYFVKEVYLYLLSKLSGAVMAPLFAMPGYVA